LEAGVSYSAKSAYPAYVHGSVTFELWKILWKSWAQISARFFFGWLSETGAELLTDWQEEDCLTWNIVPFVIRRRRRFNIYLFPV
jgi:hypothetical protein